MGAAVAGAVIGVAVGALLGAVRGGAAFGVAYGSLTAGSIWTVSAIIAGNRADGMAGIGDLVLGGVLLWVMVVPAGIATLVLELRKQKHEPRTRQ